LVLYFAIIVGINCNQAHLLGNLFPSKTKKITFLIGSTFDFAELLAKISVHISSALCLLVINNLNCDAAERMQSVPALKSPRIYYLQL
jgi:hypothetical protein